MCRDDHILDTLCLDTMLATSTYKWSPTEATPLRQYDYREGPQRSFGYSSVVGMLMYLSSYNQPDIDYTVKYCARNILKPRTLHEKALRHIMVYPKATRGSGLILRSTSKLNIEAYPGTYFDDLCEYKN